MGHGLPKIIDRYAKILDWSLHHRFKLILGAAGSVVVSIAIFAMFNAGSELFPEDIPPSNLYVQVKAPVGNKIERTDEFVREMILAALTRLEG